MQIDDLFEAPIEDFNLVGDWSKNSSFRHEQDRKILTNPRAQEQIKHKWSKTIVPFNMYFVNSPEAGRFAEIGEVDSEWLADNMPKTVAQVKLRNDAVNVIFTNNRGDERLPMTAWIIAHRLGHATDRMDYGKGRQVWEQQEIRDLVFRYISSIFTDGYQYDYFPDSERRYASKRIQHWDRDASVRSEQILMAFFEAIGTMRSARSKNLRNQFEFFHELFAQYLITGKITFNDLPRHLSFGRFGHNGLSFKGGPGDYDYYNDQLQGLAEALVDYFDTLMHSLVGRIFVM